MTPLFVILSVIVVLTLLLFLNPKVQIMYADGIVVKAGVGPLMIKIISSDKKKKKIKLRDFSQKKYLKKIAELKTKKSAPKKEKTDHKKKAKGSANDMVELVLEIVSRLEKYFGRIGTRISRLRVSVGGKDTSDAAVKYGVACQAVAYLIEILNMKTKLKIGKKDDVSVSCDYFTRDIKIDADITVNIRVIDALKTGIELLVLKLKHDEKINARIQKKTPKGRK